jgi:hypothetical protein
MLLLIVQCSNYIHFRDVDHFKIYIYGIMNFVYAIYCTLCILPARIYRPSFHENKPNTLVFSHTKRAFWACFRENWVYNFGHRAVIYQGVGT